MGTAIKHDMPDWVKLSFVIFNIRGHYKPGTLTLRTERHSAWMSKITNDGLIQSGISCFKAVPWQQ